MAIGQMCGFGSANGTLCRWTLPLLAVLVLQGTARPARAEDAETVDVARWQELLRAQSSDFAAARLDFRQADQALRSGDPLRARQLLERATTEDRRFGDPHTGLFWLDVRAGRPTSFNELVEANRDRWLDYRNQVLASSNILLTLDLITGVFLLWVCGLMLFRYMPWVHHRVAQSVLVENHRARFARWLWPTLLAPFAAALSWGILPWFSLSAITVWIHSDRRVRMLLGGALVFLVLQGVWARPVGTILTGTDPTSPPALANRAAFESPTKELRKDLDHALAIHPGDADLLSARGLFLARRGEFDASATDLQNALELRPEDAITTTNLAAVHFFRGDMDRAVAGFQRAVSLDSSLAVSHYDLSQAYLQKLFMKEGGDALQRALSRNFDVRGQVEQLPRGGVYFARPRLKDSWRMAWEAEATLTPFHLLGRHARILGVPARYVGTWLTGTLIACILLPVVFPRRKLVFECANCGALSCKHCRGEHEGAVLCKDCGNIARRAKSEMVLTTLLRNRRREANLRYQGLLRALDRIFPGGGRLIDGAQRRGVVSALMMSVGIVAVVLGRAPLANQWVTTDNGLVTDTRIFGAVLILIAFFVNSALRTTMGARHLQPHPSGSVSVGGLIETRRAGAGG